MGGLAAQKAAVTRTTMVTIATSGGRIEPGAAVGWREGSIPALFCKDVGDGQESETKATCPKHGCPRGASWRGLPGDPHSGR